MSVPRLQKHERLYVKMVEEEGCEVLEVLPGTRAHKKLRIRLPSGETTVAAMSSSPKNVEHMIKGGRRQIRAAMAGQRWGAKA